MAIYIAEVERKPETLKPPVCKENPCKLTKSLKLKTEVGAFGNKMIRPSRAGKVR